MPLIIGLLLPGETGFDAVIAGGFGGRLSWMYGTADEHSDALPAASVALADSWVAVFCVTVIGIAYAVVPDVLEPASPPVQSAVRKTRTVVLASAVTETIGVSSLFDGDVGVVCVIVGALGAVASKS